MEDERKKANVVVHILMASCQLEVAAVSDRPPAVALCMEPDRCLLVAQAATAEARSQRVVGIQESWKFMKLCMLVTLAFPIASFAFEVLVCAGAMQL